jgi:hypothetical protein
MRNWKILKTRHTFSYCFTVFCAMLHLLFRRVQTAVALRVTHKYKTEANYQSQLCLALLCCVLHCDMFRQVFYICLISDFDKSRNMSQYSLQQNTIKFHEIFLSSPIELNRMFIMYIITATCFDTLNRIQLCNTAKYYLRGHKFT